MIYAARGDYVNASLSTAAMVPIVGWPATGTKLVKKGVAKFIPKGFKQTKKFGYLHGQKVYEYKGLYYSKDIDSHNGGVWKVFEEINGKPKRIGTADENLNIFKK